MSAFSVELVKVIDTEQGITLLLMQLSVADHALLAAVKHLVALAFVLQDSVLVTVFTLGVNICNILKLSLVLSALITHLYILHLLLFEMKGLVLVSYLHNQQTLIMGFRV